MTNHRDPIEEWLGRDIEVLPPPQGSFQRVRRRARRRKAVQAMGVAAGVVVVVAAGISIPALTGNLLQGNTGPAKLGNGTPTTAPTRTQPAASSRPAPTPAAPTRSFPGPGLAAAAAAGTAPPAGFRPSSVTFAGDHGKLIGAVLGQAPCPASSGLCTTLAATTSYGASWARAGAPAAGPAAVSQVRFADPADGWAFGPGLYATHDGGAHWRAIDAGGINTNGYAVVDLSAVGSHVLAVVTRPSPASCPPSSPVCKPFTLYSAAAGGDRWTAVPGGSGSGAVTAGGLQLTPAGGYLMAGGRLYAGPLGGGAWRKVPATGAGAPGCLASPQAPDTRLIAAGRGTVYLACGTANLDLYSSGNEGVSWRALGTGPVPAGSATSLAVSPAGHLVLATTSGLFYSDTGQKWIRATAGSAANLAFRYIGMTTATRGVAVPASPSARAVFVTSDGGRTWRASQISR